MTEKVLLTGGAGFIGHQAIKKILENSDWEILTFDRLSYAGNLKRIDDIYEEVGDSSRERLNFVYHDLKAPLSDEIINTLNDVTYIVHIGASSHVTKSVQNPGLFIQDNIVGTFNLLEAARKIKNLKMFYYFSTDEVFGPSDQQDKFLEWDRYNSKNPYSATKAAAEHIIEAYSNTYGVNFITVRMSNNFGPRQHAEKFIPTIIRSLSSNKKIPIYGNGKNVRDWLYVKDCVKMIKLIQISGSPGEVYNISNGNERNNIEICKIICDSLDKDFEKFSKFVPDRPGHDFRYSINFNKIKNLGITVETDFKKAIEETVRSLR